MKKKDPTRPILRNELTRRIEKEKRILANVKKWPRAEWKEGNVAAPEPQNPSSEQPVANPQFEVRVITLRECQLHGTEEQGKHFKLGLPKMVKHPIEEVLGPGGKKYLENTEKDTIRYLHLPANDMDWIEVRNLTFIVFIRENTDVSQRLMANYYNPRDLGNYNDRGSDFYRRGASSVLRREFSQGQQHGSNADPIHARHMRPRCSVIPPGNFISTP